MADRITVKFSVDKRGEAAIDRLHGILVFLRVAINGAMTFNSGEALVAAAAAGLGIIQVAEYYAQPLIESGQLVELLPAYKTQGYDISVVFPQQNRVVPKLRVFVDFLVSIFDPPPWTKGAHGRAAKPRESLRHGERALVR